MSEYTEVEQPFLAQLKTLGWDVIDQGQDIPSDPAKSLRSSFRQWILPQAFERAVAAVNPGSKSETWLTSSTLTPNATPAASAAKKQTPISNQKTTLEEVTRRLSHTAPPFCTHP